MRPGCSMSDSTAPSDSARVNTDVAALTASVACGAAGGQEAHHAAEVRASGAAATAWPGWSARPGYSTRSTAGWATSRSTTASALAAWRSMRTGERLDAPQHQVAVERAGHRADRVLQEPDLVGELRCRWWPRTRRPRRSARPGTSSSSAPRRRRPGPSGCCRYGVANVLSTTSLAPWPWASSATPGDVDDVEQWVGRRLDPHQAGAVRPVRRQRSGVAEVGRRST